MIEVFKLPTLNVVLRECLVETVEQFTERGAGDRDESGEVGVAISREPFGEVSTRGRRSAICLVTEPEVPFHFGLGAQLHNATANGIGLLPRA